LHLIQEEKEDRIIYLLSGSAFTGSGEQKIKAKLRIYINKVRHPSYIRASNMDMVKVLRLY
jgi:hypothetical protein